jgi:unsaturated rhamnogalacturonyl hydrolase
MAASETRRGASLFACLILAASCGSTSPGSGNTGSGGSGSPGTGGAATGSGGAGGAGTGSGGSSGSGGSNPSGNGGAGSGGATTDGGRGGAGGTAGADAGADGPALTLPASSLAVRFANAVMARWPDARNINGGTPAFEYNVGIVLRGIQAVYDKTGDAKYLTYIQKWVDSFVSAAGVVTMASGYSFDNVEPANLILFLYEKTGMAKYQTAAQSIRAKYDTWPRNAEQGFYHKDTYPNQMWLDSIYMGEPFLAKYGSLFSCTPFCHDTVIQQITLIASHVRDTSTGLLYHAWDQSKMATWADATTGRSPVIWGRALGWYAMSLVDILPFLPSGDAGATQMLDILRGLASALKTTQDASGLWHQVVDMGTRSDDYLEESGSGMFVYALRLAVRRGYIDASYMDTATKGWNGLQQMMVTSDATGPVISGAVQGMGVQATYALYVDQTMFMKKMNSSHGLCAILLAASEMEAQ